MMIFGEKSNLTEKRFSATDLIQYVESLIKEARLQERRTTNNASNYGWLKSKETYMEDVDDLRELRPLIRKLSPESCASIAVKLDNMADDSSLTVAQIISTLKRLVLEQDSMQSMQKNVTRAKEMKRMNKVHPELEPGRQATVCFIVDSDIK